MLCLLKQLTNYNAMNAMTKKPKNNATQNQTTATPAHYEELSELLLESVGGGWFLWWGNLEWWEEWWNWWKKYEEPKTFNGSIIGGEKRKRKRNRIF